MEEKHSLVFKEKIRREQNSVSLIFTPEEEFKWIPGQSITVRILHEDMDDRGDTRTFTISSAPSEGFVMITTRDFRERASSFKKAFFKLQEGDRIEVSNPFFSEGGFEVENPSLDYIFITGGIGVMPVRSILKEFELTNKQLKGTVIYDNKDDQYIFGEELDNIAKKFARFTVQPYHTKEIDEFTLDDLHMRYPTGIFMISGPSKFVEYILNVLKDMGISDNHIRYLSFKDGYTEI